MSRKRILLGGKKHIKPKTIGEWGTLMEQVEPKDLIPVEKPGGLKLKDDLIFKLKGGSYRRHSLSSVDGLAELGRPTVIKANPFKLYGFAVLDSVLDALVEYHTLGSSFGEVLPGHQEIYVLFKFNETSVIRVPLAQLSHHKGNGFSMISMAEFFASIIPALREVIPVTVSTSDKDARWTVESDGKGWDGLELMMASDKKKGEDQLAPEHPFACYGKMAGEFA